MDHRSNAACARYADAAGDRVRIDNIIFLSLVVAKLPTAQRGHARRLGLAAAMVMRLVLLASIARVTRLTNPLFEIFGQEISARDLILLLGGLF